MWAIQCLLHGTFTQRAEAIFIGINVHFIATKFLRLYIAFLLSLNFRLGLAVV